MKRTAFDPASDQVVNPSEGADGRFPCSFCKTPTLRETLSMYGSRCYFCYETYCRESQRPTRAGASRQAGIVAMLKAEPPIDEARIEQLKRESAHRVAEYGRRNGISTQ